MKNTDLAVVILSCDRFSETWEPCIDHFFRAWPSCPFRVYLLNNVVPSLDNRVNDLLVGIDKGWSDSLLKGLAKLKEKRVLFIYDDSFIMNFNLPRLIEVVDLAKRENLDSVALRKRSFDSGKPFNKIIYKIDPKAKYRNSLFMNLIKKEVLVNLLVRSESAWQFEKEGNKRNAGYDFYSVYEKGLVSYKHGIIKGKWLPDTYSYLQELGYLSNSTLGTHKKLRVYLMKIYSYVFTFAHNILNNFRLVNPFK